MNQLAQLKQYTTVVADTGDFHAMEVFKPHDATTNPSLILKAVQKPEYRPLLEETVKAHRGAPVGDVIDQLLVAFGRKISEQGVWRERIAESRIMIDSARLLVLKAAYMMDTVGNKVAKSEIAMIKVLAPVMAQQVIDWAIQAHGGGGVSDDFPLAQLWAHNRTLRLADGPDEVHRNAIAKLELAKYVSLGESLDLPVTRS